jgi:hypothetical protein
MPRVYHGFAAPVHPEWLMERAQEKTCTATLGI